MLDENYYPKGFCKDCGARFTCIVHKKICSDKSPMKTQCCEASGEKLKIGKHKPPTE